MADLTPPYPLPPPPRIRVISLALIRRPSDGRWLAMYGTDPLKGEEFYRPAGGGVEFGESSRDAVCREMLEEFGAVVEPVQCWGTRESIFTHMGKPGHEIVFLWECRFVDESFYTQDELKIDENGLEMTAHWIDPDDLAARGIAFYPNGLSELLRSSTFGKSRTSEIPSALL